MPLSTQLPKGFFFNPLNLTPSSPRTDRSNEQTNAVAVDNSGNIFGRVLNAGNRLIQIVTDPRAQALARVSVSNPRLGALLLRLGTSENIDINSLRREDLTLIVDNLDLLQETGFLDAVRNDINDPRLEAFLRLRSRDKGLSDSLARLFIRSVTTENFNINDITTDEMLLIGNNLDVIEETGLLSSIKSDLPSEVNKVLEFRENNPGLFRTALKLGNTFPFLVDFAKDVINEPARGYFTAGATALGACGFGVLCFAKLGLFCAIPAFLPAIALGGLIGFGVGALLSCKPVTNFLSGVGNAIGSMFSSLKFW